MALLLLPLALPLLDEDDDGAGVAEAPEFSDEDSPELLLPDSGSLLDELELPEELPSLFDDDEPEDEEPVRRGGCVSTAVSVRKMVAGASLPTRVTAAAAAGAASTLAGARARTRPAVSTAAKQASYDSEQRCSLYERLRTLYQVLDGCYEILHSVSCDALSGRRRVRRLVHDLLVVTRHQVLNDVARDPFYRVHRVRRLGDGL